MREGAPMRRWTFAVTVMALVLTAGTPGVFATAAAQEIHDQRLARLFPHQEGFEFHVVRQVILDMNKSAPVLPLVSVQWLPLAPSQQVDGREPVPFGEHLDESGTLHGRHLLTVVAGEVVIDRATTQESLTESAYVTAADAYAIRNDSNDCAHILRLTLLWVPLPGEVSSIPAKGLVPPPGPETAALDCGQPDQLARFEEPRLYGAPAPQSWRLFTAQVSLADGEVFASSGPTIGHRGPVFYFVKEGAMSIVMGSAHVKVTAGGWIGFEAMSQYAFSVEAPFQALLIGVDSNEK